MKITYTAKITKEFEPKTITYSAWNNGSEDAAGYETEEYSSFEELIASFNGNWRTRFIKEVRNNFPIPTIEKTDVAYVATYGDHFSNVDHVVIKYYF